MPHTQLEFLGKPIAHGFTIPSGIVTTRVAAIAKLAYDIPELGIITTKSIGIDPRAGYREPVFTQYAPGCFMNAVGLANPGAEAFARELGQLQMPADRFLLVSIFGKDADEFVQAAKILAPLCDGLELNLSCPHAKGYGMAMGQDPEMVQKITAAVKGAVKVPVIPKLTPNVPDIAEIAKAAKAGGADALCAINTVGPGFYTAHGHAVLSNQTGGMSGKGILPIGLKCVRDISQSVRLPIIACGGISSADDVRAYQAAGASIFGVGSALTGLSTQGLKRYFKTLAEDLDRHENFAAGYLAQDVDTHFRPFTLAANQPLADDLSVLVFNEVISVRPGQFIFVWIPGVGEKPFSVLDNNPLTLSIRKAGCFTKALCALAPGARAYVRGPYGRPVKTHLDAHVVLVSGGCGLAALYHIARENDQVTAFIGARDRRHLFYLDKLEKFAKVHVATDDGSLGHKGPVTDILAQELKQLPDDKPFVFYNCGPAPMIEAALDIQKRFAAPEQIFNSVDYVTRCGVGVCGSCTAPDGRRLCVDGPFLESAA